MIFVDSTIWIDYFNGCQSEKTDYLDSLLGKEFIVIGDLVYTEVLQGFRSDHDFERAKETLDLLLFREMLGHDMALRSAINYRFLRKKGITVRKTIDVIISTFCIVNGLALLHSDRDFNPMERYLGLNVIGPS